MSGRSAKALASTTKTKGQVQITRGRNRRVEPTDYAPKATQDDVEDVEIVESQHAPMVPILAFVAATLMEGYESDPIELCWPTIEAIRKRASADENAVDAFRLGGGVVRPSVAFQHRRTRPPRSQLLNPVWSIQSNRSPPTDGQVDAGGASRTSRRESSEYPRGERQGESVGKPRTPSGTC